MKRMKNLIFLFSFFCCTTLLFAQEDRFTDVNQAKGKEVYVIDNSAVSVAYMIVEGKVKPVQKVKKANISMSGNVYTVEKDEYTYKKNSYIVLKGPLETILLKPEDAPLYLSSLVSRTYWQEKYDSYRNEYIYLDIKKSPHLHSSSATVEYDALSRIAWTGIDVTENGATYYMREIDGEQRLNQFTVTSTEFEKTKGTSFLKKDAIQPYIERYEARLAKEKRDKEIADSIANGKLRLAIAQKDAKYMDDEREINVYKGDTLAIFSYKVSEGKFRARYHLANLLFKAEDIEFLDTKTTTTEGKYSWERKTVKTSADADYLRAKGEEGVKQRFLVAAEFDKVQTKNWINRVTAVVDEYNKEVAYKKKKQIFITGIGYEHDSNEYSHAFGMRIKIYNCFSKTIKYVEFTLTNYNAVGDVQRDNLGRSSRTVKGIGPIEPEEGGTYSWDDIFWDENEIIERTKLTRIKFIFKDGTTKVFTGSANIDKHMSDDAWD